jgi:pimeloyl-ACP methyl ester carboxylesterase
MTQKNSDTKINVYGKLLYTEYYNEYPNRPTIVFLHDSLGCVQLWRDFPFKLAQVTQCNILIYDRLGYGKSEAMLDHERPLNYMELEASTLNHLLTTLKIEDAILFGHSDGGTIALITASKFPDKIKAIICEAAHIFVENITLEGICDAMETYKTSSLPERLTKYHGDKVDTLFKAWTDTWTSTAYRNWNIEHFLKDISCSLLFIQGDCDEYGTLLQVEKTVAQIKGKAEKFIIPNIGHTPHKESPELVFDAVKTFIKNLE